MAETLKSWRAQWLALQAHEVRAVLLAAGYFFCLLASYYLVRPLRDEMAVTIGTDRLVWVFTAVFAAMLLLVPLFGALTARIARARLLPWLYVGCMLVMAAFGVLLMSDIPRLWLAAPFYVWVSVFNLFAVSVFWSFMTDLFDTAQAKRLYGMIAAGGTLGAIAGPAMASLALPLLTEKALPWLSALMLVGVLGCLLGLKRWSAAYPRARDDASEQGMDRAMGGSAWVGLKLLLSSRYLLLICGYLLLYALTSTLLYFQQTALLKQAVADPTQRTQWLAAADLVVNVLTLLVQLGLFGALMQRVGTLGMLVVMPLLSVFGFAALALAPGLPVLMVFGILRRAGEYAVSKPARETLFNVLPPQQRYQAKNAIDTLVHRFGDTASGWVFQGLRTLGLSMAAVAWLAVPASLLWLLGAWALGRRAGQKPDAAAEVAAQPTPTAR